MHDYKLGVAAVLCMGEGELRALIVVRAGAAEFSGGGEQKSSRFHSGEARKSQSVFIPEMVEDEAGQALRQALNQSLNLGVLVPRWKYAAHLGG